MLKVIVSDKLTGKSAIGFAETESILDLVQETLCRYISRDYKVSQGFFAPFVKRYTDSVSQLDAKLDFAFECVLHNYAIPDLYEEASA